MKPDSIRPAARPLSWVGLIAIVGVIFGVPALLDQGGELRRSFNERPLRALEKARPRGILLGDSMLETRIDPQVLSTAAGERWEVVAQPGASSATWYLMLKNLVTVQKPPPRTAILFFRDRQLTLPAHRTDGGYRKTMESYMRGPEPVFTKILERTLGEERSWLERLSLAAYPVQWRRVAWHDKIQSWALDLVASSRDYDRIRGDARAIFGLQNLRRDSGMDFEQQEGGQRGLDPDKHDFATEVGRSFLPQIIEIAREKQIQLVFFRVKRKPLPAGAVRHESDTLPHYVRELRHHLESAGARLIDETTDPEVTVDFYGADDHVAPPMMKAYTELFWRKVGPQLSTRGAAP